MTQESWRKAYLNIVQGGGRPGQLFVTKISWKNTTLTFISRWSKPSSLPHLDAKKVEMCSLYFRWLCAKLEVGISGTSEGRSNVIEL